MACNAADIPSLSFPRNEIIEITPASYNNESSRIKIEGLPTEIIPSSPEDIKIPVPPSGTISPMPLDTPPKTGAASPQNPTGSPLKYESRTPAEPANGEQSLAEMVPGGKQP